MIDRNEVYAVLNKHEDGEFGLLTTTDEDNQEKALEKIKVKRSNWINSHFPMADLRIGVIRFAANGTGAWELVKLV